VCHSHPFGGSTKRKKHRPGNNSGQILGALNTMCVHLQLERQLPRAKAGSNFTHTQSSIPHGTVLGIDCVRAGVPNCGAKKKKRGSLRSAKCPRKQKGLWPVKEFNYSGFGRRTNWIAPLSPAFYRPKSFA
jgi:hypothetical protein